MLILASAAGQADADLQRWQADDADEHIAVARAQPSGTEPGQRRAGPVFPSSATSMELADADLIAHSLHSLLPRTPVRYGK
jgi:hypothetical protein